MPPPDAPMDTESDGSAVDGGGGGGDVGADTAKGASVSPKAEADAEGASSNDRGVNSQSPVPLAVEGAASPRRTAGAVATDASTPVADTATPAEAADADADAAETAETLAEATRDTTTAAGSGDARGREGIVCCESAEKAASPVAPAAAAAAATVTAAPTATPSTGADTDMPALTSPPPPPAHPEGRGPPPAAAFQPSADSPAGGPLNYGTHVAPGAAGWPLPMGGVPFGYGYGYPPQMHVSAYALMQRALAAEFDVAVRRAGRTAPPTAAFSPYAPTHAGYDMGGTAAAAPSWRMPSADHPPSAATPPVAVRRTSGMSAKQARVAEKTSSPPASQTGMRHTSGPGGDAPAPASASASASPARGKKAATQQEPQLQQQQCSWLTLLPCHNTGAMLSRRTYTGSDAIDVVRKVRLVYLRGREKDTNKDEDPSTAQNRPACKLTATPDGDPGAYIEPCRRNVHVVVNGAPVARNAKTRIVSGDEVGIEIVMTASTVSLQYVAVINEEALRIVRAAPDEGDADVTADVDTEGAAVGNDHGAGPAKQQKRCVKPAKPTAAGAARAPAPAPHAPETGEDLATPVATGNPAVPPPPSLATGPIERAIDDAVSRAMASYVRGAPQAPPPVQHEQQQQQQPPAKAPAPAPAEGQPPAKRRKVVVRKPDAVAGEGSPPHATAQTTVAVPGASRETAVEAAPTSDDGATVVATAAATAALADVREKLESPTDGAAEADIATAAAELQANVVLPDANTTDLNDAAFPYYVDTAERMQLHHALSLALHAGDGIGCLERVPRTLCFDTALSAGDGPHGTTTTSSGTGGGSAATGSSHWLHAEMVVKGVARELGACYLWFDPSALTAVPPTPSPLQALNLAVKAKTPDGGQSKEGGSGSADAGDTPTRPAPLTVALGLRRTTPIEPPYGKAEKRVYAVGEVVYVKGAGDANAGASPAGPGGDAASAKAVAPLRGAGAVGTPALHDQLLGDRAVVVQTFPANPHSRRVGVCFKDPQPGGTDLGGRCPPGHGMFVDTRDLRPGAADGMASLHALLRVAEQHRPLVVFAHPHAMRHYLKDSRAVAAVQRLFDKAPGRLCFVTTTDAFRKTTVRVAPTGLPAAPAARVGKGGGKGGGAAGGDDGSGPTDAAARASRAKRVAHPAGGIVHGGEKEAASASPIALRLLLSHFLETLFPVRLPLTPTPSRAAARRYADAQLSQWTARVAADRVFVRTLDNVALLHHVFLANGVCCPWLGGVCKALKLQPVGTYSLARMPSAPPRCTPPASWPMHGEARALCVLWVGDQEREVRGQWLWTDVDIQSNRKTLRGLEKVPSQQHE